MNANNASASRIKSILIIDDDELYLTLLKTFCAKLAPQAKIEMYNPLTNGRPGEDYNWAQFDLLFLDYNLGKGENGLDWMRTYCGKEGFPATIMLTAEGNEELAVAAMRVGAKDYLNKLKISMEKLEQAISNAQAQLARQEFLAVSRPAPQPVSTEIAQPIPEQPKDTNVKPVEPVADQQQAGPEKEKDGILAGAPAIPQAAKKAGNVIDLPGAIKNNRIQPYFRPFIALSDTATQIEADFFQLRVNVLAVNEAAVPQEELAMAEFKSGNPGMLDLWVVRFALSQLVNLNQAAGARKHRLFIRLFEESLADNKLYDWTKGLLAKIKTANVSSTIVFEINPPAFLKHKNNAMNFINQARDSWGTGFALYDVLNAGVFEACQKQAGFEFLEISVSAKDKNLITSLVEGARTAGLLTILENIGSAAELNLAIECKFDYGQGDFIQPPLDKLDLTSETSKFSPVLVGPVLTCHLRANEFAPTVS